MVENGKEGGIKMYIFKCAECLRDIPESDKFIAISYGKKISICHKCIRLYIFCIKCKIYVKVTNNENVCEDCYYKGGYKDFFKKQKHGSSRKQSYDDQLLSYHN